MKSVANLVRFALAFSLFAAVVPNTFATLLVYEGFDYPAGPGAGQASTFRSPRMPQPASVTQTATAIRWQPAAAR
jgi:hypothetical protein